MVAKKGRSTGKTSSVQSHAQPSKKASKLVKKVPPPAKKEKEKKKANKKASPANVVAQAKVKRAKPQQKHTIPIKKVSTKKEDKIEKLEKKEKKDKKVLPKEKVGKIEKVEPSEKVEKTEKIEKVIKEKAKVTKKPTKAEAKKTKGKNVDIDEEDDEELLAAEIEDEDEEEDLDGDLLEGDDSESFFVEEQKRRQDEDEDEEEEDFEKKFSDDGPSLGELKKKEMEALKRQQGENFEGEIGRVTMDYNLDEIRAAVKGMDFYVAGDTDECLERYCENIQTTQGYCRYHYIKNWKSIKKRAVILQEGKLQQLIEELIFHYPLKYIEAIMKDLSGDKEFFQVLKDLNIESNFSDDEVVDGDVDDDITVETRGYGGVRMKFDEEEV